MTELVTRSSYACCGGSQLRAAIREQAENASVGEAKAAAGAGGYGGEVVSAALE
jgi:hypothetical protein